MQQCVDLIRNARCIGALTGAGISTNAGIPDFRGPQGLYVSKRYDPDTIFDIQYFLKDPVPFFEFARDFVGLENKIKPTVAHHVLCLLETHEKLKGVITQNIDSLHYQAGSQTVYEMHGSFWWSYCLNCDKKFSYAQMKMMIFAEAVPHCACGGVIKPDIVFFGENVKRLEESTALARSADLFFVVGTSCVVYPAAALPSMVSGKIVVVNQDDVDLGLCDVAFTAIQDIDQFFGELAGALAYD